MVRLDRIYTKSGDDGTTSLGDGKRVPKHHLRVDAYGTVDELSSVLGLVVAQGIAEPLGGELRAIQNDLFDVGADLCVPGEAGAKLRLTAAPSTRLEEEIAAMNASLPPLNSFVLPGGTPAAVHAHLARTVVRRAEREVTALAEHEPVNPEVIRFLNRLSDHLFVLSRRLNGGHDVLWVPGANRSTSGAL